MEKFSEKICVVIPAFNEEAVISETVAEVRKFGYENIIVVDDGSSDQTAEKARAAGVLVLQHSINRGKGAAVKTGIEAAKLLDAHAIVTLDADGQHNPENISRMISLIRNGKDVVLGTRLKNSKGMPLHKIIQNKLGNFFTWSAFGLWVTDSQSGFRAYSRKAVNLIDTKTDRYEYDSEVIREIKKHRLEFAEVPIEVRYTEYSLSKKCRMNWKNGLKIVIKTIISG